MVDAERSPLRQGQAGPAGTLAFLRGSWELSRSVRDGGRTGGLEGAATFSPVGYGTLMYYETGVLSFAGRDLRVTRSYRYRARKDGVVEVSFDDGRFFHLLDLREGRWQAEHRCGRDRYHGTFSVRTGDLFTTHWRITSQGDTGCAKDQELISTYRRLPVGPTPPSGA